MGAISHPSSVPILKEYLADSDRSVRETCEIAVSKIEWDNSEEGKKHHESLIESSTPYVPFPFYTKYLSYSFSLYTSIDPAPPSSCLLLNSNSKGVSEARIAQLQQELVDPNLPLFQRYRAMFSLRNIGTPAAVDALASGFTDDSALFK